MRGKLRETTAADAVLRALSMIGYCPPLPITAPDDAELTPIRYRLSKSNGGKDPDAKHPADWSYGERIPTCDCTGFVCWSLGLDRKQPKERFTPYGGWINTDSAIEDASTKKQLFEFSDEPVLGSPIVYGGQRKGGKRVRVGHWGIVVASSTDFDPELRTKKNFALVRVVHCSSSLSKKTGAAIHETPASIWATRGRFLRYKLAA